MATVELLERYPKTEIITDGLDTNLSQEAGTNVWGSRAAP